MSQERQNTITACTIAAIAIAQMPVSEYGQWIAYLAEGLESRTDAPADDWLADAVAELTRRMVDGSW